MDFSVDFHLKNKTLTSLFNHRPCQSTDQVHDEEADHWQVNVQQRIRHQELCQFHHQRLHPEVAGHVPANAEEEKANEERMKLKTPLPAVLWDHFDKLC